MVMCSLEMQGKFTNQGNTVDYVVIGLIVFSVCFNCTFTLLMETHFILLDFRFHENPTKKTTRFLILPSSLSKMTIDLS